MSNGKRIPITNKSTGEVRLSEPVPGSKSWQQDVAKPNAAGETEPVSTSTPTEVAGELMSSREQSPDERPSAPAKVKRGEKTGTKQEKPESLADYIEYAYGRKGQKLADLKEKVGFIRSLASNFRLGEREV